MPIRVDFLPPEAHGLPGRVGLTFAPGKRDGTKWNRDLHADLNRLRTHYGTHLLVSLMEDFEYDLLAISGLVPMALAQDIRVRRFPIVDGDAPSGSQMGEFIRLIVEIEQSAETGEVVVIHCRGGLGRAGTVAAAFLVLRGHAPEQAIAIVRATRSQRAVESDSQAAWVARVATELRTA